MKVRNNIIPNNHFHKKWDELVKTWFDQPAAKQRRRIARTKKVRNLTTERCLCALTDPPPSLPLCYCRALLVPSVPR